MQGYFELRRAGMAERGSEQLTGFELNPKQVACIQNHLNMVFKHEIDPSHGDEAHQVELAKAHAGGAAGESPVGALPQSSPFGDESLKALREACPLCHTTRLNC